MGFILAIETATTNCSVSISDNGNLLGVKEDNSATYSHAESLHVFIKELLMETGVAMDRLDAIAVSKGPGSYTGLRIGVSTAKGLCYALDKPLIAIPTLESLALQVKENQGIVVPMIDARRMEVYSTVISAETKKQLRATQAEIVTEQSFATYLNESKVFFIGNGVDKFEELCQHPNAVFIKNKLPSAKEMAILGFQSFQNKKFVDLSYFEPYYLKDFVSG
ncbi:tRNA (adenosine(37)-N6)-threonylcarbamoyltransferase complex dimerization subunit type 1 TsaB [Aquimarina brevivitae]|uniref:tRNA threonylcarbamoyladenosine biosynthesis protein TsaB n=1 Tax=Aquimarina brevivitae TaxID=323412 RepID=A0A4Q7PEG5_9FLAO|nr:tRNA (adenosine(37)-N6)-threonylcarbamoyltransferase complex dimerization subunit type 1 TsaB [Aquimarina brevivitae]RZS98843.1 tRNA threonylcarbamoyladenosine biosynthesis protein TsaB [Aquimarina brevivitae]